MEATASGDTGLTIREGVINDKGFVRVIHRIAIPIHYRESNQATVITAHVDGDDGALGDSVAQKEVGDPVHHRRQVPAEVKMQGRNEKRFQNITYSGLEASKQNT